MYIFIYFWTIFSNIKNMELPSNCITRTVNSKAKKLVYFLLEPWELSICFVDLNLASWHQYDLFGWAVRVAYIRVNRDKTLSWIKKIHINLRNQNEKRSNPIKIASRSGTTINSMIYAWMLGATASDHVEPILFSPKTYIYPLNSLHSPTKG